LPEQPVPEFLADLVTNVSHVNGVFRLTLAQQDANNEVRPVAKLLIPANQLGSILQGVGKAAKDIANQVQAQSQAKKKDE
jgi:hypothetical protein